MSSSNVIWTRKEPDGLGVREQIITTELRFRSVSIFGRRAGRLPATGIIYIYTDTSKDTEDFLMIDPLNPQPIVITTPDADLSRYYVETTVEGDFVNCSSVT